MRRKKEGVILVGFLFQACISKCALVVLASYEWCILKKYCEKVTFLI